MTVVRVRYDDWLALLIAFRRKLDLKTGDELEIVSTDEGILLRRASQAAGSLAREFASMPSRVEELHIPAASVAEEPAAAPMTAEAPVPSEPTAMPAAKPRPV